MIVNALWARQTQQGNKKLSVLVRFVSVEQQKNKEENLSNNALESKIKKHEEQLVMELSIQDVDPSTGTQKLYRQFLWYAFFNI